MILIDSCALYPLNDRTDKLHKIAAERYRELKAANTNIALTQPIMVEAWHLVESRKNSFYADKLWEMMIGGLFHILELGNADLTRAFGIRQKYADSKMSIVDATSLAACERYRVSQVFTFDREHFGIYKPSFAEYLEILPEN